MQSTTTEPSLIVDMYTIDFHCTCLEGCTLLQPWVRTLVAPPFFPALSHFQRSTDVMAQLVSLRT